MIRPPSESLNNGVGGISTDKKVKGEFVIFSVQPSVILFVDFFFLISRPIASKPS